MPGTGLREPKSPEELRGLIDEAGREAAEAAQRQRLPRGDAEMTRGFYEKQGFVICGEAINWRSGAPVHKMSWRPAQLRSPD